MEWQTLLSLKRLGETRPPTVGEEEGRSEFQRDFDRIVFSTAFRRLQNKTQVIPIPVSDHIHNRLTHSLETCCIGRSLGQRVGEKLISKYGVIFGNIKVAADDFADIVSAACLAHDIGNPPLGHSGEAAISEYFSKECKKILENLTPEQRADFENYEGNAMGFRMLTHSFPYETKLKGGMSLNFTTLAAFTKYPKESIPDIEQPKAVSEEKYGFLQADKETFRSIAEELQLKPKQFAGHYGWFRHPLAFLVEAADDICTRIMDFEDGYKLNWVSFKDIEKRLKKIIGDDLNKSEYNNRKIYHPDRKIKYLRARAINQLIDQVTEYFIMEETNILEGNFDNNIIKLIPARDILDEISEISQDKIYNNKEVVKIEAAGFTVLPGLLDAFINALMEHFNSRKSDEKISSKSLKILQMIPDQYFARGRQPFRDKYTNILNVVQFVAGMTDDFAIRTYRIIKGIEF